MPPHPCLPVRHAVAWAIRLGLGLALSVSFALSAAAQTAVWTYHDNNARTGANTTEAILTPANVNAQQFGLLERVPVDGAIYAEPLYVPNVRLPNGQTRNLVFVATENDSVYAFDAQGISDGAETAPVWVDHFADPAQGIAPQTPAEVHCQDLSPWIGITGTPVIDLSTNTLYLVAATMENGQPVQRLHALDLATGAEKFGGSAVIAATVPGTGSGSVNGQLSFDPLRQFQRPGLLLSQGTVFVAWGSHCDYQPFHGWLMAFNAATLQLTGAMATTPNEVGGGIWGGAPAADASGAIYMASGNWGFDPVTSDLGESVIKAEEQNGQLAATDFFAPYDVNALSAKNEDMSSQGVVLLPPLSGETVPEAIAGDKAGDLFVLNRNNLGGYVAGAGPDTQILQELPGVSAGVMGTPAYWNGFWYQVGTGDGGGDFLQAFAVNANGLLSPAPAFRSSHYFEFPAGVPVVSANGDSNGIVWLVQADAWSSGGPEVLHAFNALNLQELYNSTQNAARDQAGPAVKFAVPAVADGQVFVPAGGELDIYGLLPGQFTVAAAAQDSTIALGSAATVQVTTAGSGGPIQLACAAPSKGCSFAPPQVMPGGSSTLTLAASALAAGANTVAVTATQGAGTQTASLTITAQGFSLAASPASTSVLAGQSAEFQVSAAAQGGFTGSIALACSAGAAACQLAPDAITPGETSTVTLTHLPAGQVTPAQVTGSTSLGASGAVMLSVTAWDFSVLAAHPQVTVPRGSNTAQFTLATAGVAGFTGAIALSCAPSTGLTCAFSPATVNAGGDATLTVSGLAAAAADPVVLTVNATSGGDTHAVPLTIVLSDFSLTAANSSATVTPGQAATYTLTLTPIEGWTGNIALSCSGTPQASACTIAPTSVNLNGASATATVTVTTAAPSQSAAGSGPGGPGTSGRWPGDMRSMFLLALALGLAAALARGRRRWSAGLACVLLACTLAACGGAKAPAAQPVQLSTPRGSSTLTVTATSGALVHTQPLTLNVN